MLASQDRKRIREYIAEQNLIAAIELDERIGYSASNLAGQPYKGRNGRVEGTRELVIHPHFVLVYEVDSQWGKVYILRVLHTAQKWPQRGCPDIKTSDGDARTMNNDELVTRRAQAIAEDRCFSKGRLRDEFRMKPAPGAEPVKWYKNSYGGRFAVYRIADCVPMREKRPLTSKQQLAGQQLSVLSRLNSTSGRMARQAYDWLSLAPLFLDTETTGLDNTAEALEIGLTDAAGQVVFETRLKPTVAIGAQAAAVHGISEQALCGAPSWTDVARQLRHAIGDRPVIIFNARFDIRILKQTAAAHSDPADWLEELTVYCAMELAAGYYGATNRYGTISLACAASQAGLTWEGQAHSAIADARMTAGVVNAIAAYHLELLQEQARLKI